MQCHCLQNFFVAATAFLVVGAAALVDIGYFVEMTAEVAVALGAFAVAVVVAVVVAAAASASERSTEMMEPESPVVRSQAENEAAVLVPLIAAWESLLAGQ